MNYIKNIYRKVLDIDKEIKDLILQLKLYYERLLNYENFAEKQKLITSFEIIYNIVTNKDFLTFSWQDKYETTLKIQEFFRQGMGLKWEFVPKVLCENIDDLINSSNNFLRLCYKSLGNETYKINEKDLFNIGDSVYLVQRQLMYLSNQGVKEYVKIVNRHLYIIKQRLSPDISNMPLYLIEANNIKRIVRHNAIKNEFNE